VNCFLNRQSTVDENGKMPPVLQKTNGLMETPPENSLELIRKMVLETEI
jgi:hypothetical protein